VEMLKNKSFSFSLKKIKLVIFDKLQHFWS
jgi:hypothetical protein